MQIPDPQHYLNLEKGFVGEVQLDVWLEDLANDCLVVNDLLLEHKDKVFQIDTLVIFQKMIYILDAKNNEGDFYLDENRWYTLAGKEIDSPLPQMERAEFLLRQLLRQRFNSNLPIEALLIFVNPQFTLYHATPKLPAIFPTQRHSFLQKLNSIDSNINRSLEKLADQLVARHLTESRHTRWPEYKYEQLKKGVVCGECGTFMVEQGRGWVCAGCGYKENAQAAILRSVKEFKYLFPERKITSNTICEWCAVKGDRKKVVRALTNHFRHVGQGRASYYVD